MAHNTRRRQNREIQREVVDHARARGEDARVLEQLAAGSPSAAKQWAQQHDLPERLHPGHGHLSDRLADGPDGLWEQEPWAQDVVVAGQVRTTLAGQGTRPGERALLKGSVLRVDEVDEGINTTRKVTLTDGAVGYHKPFVGVDVDVADGFGQDTPQQPLHEVAAWRLASGMGEPWSGMVPPCVLREVRGQMGSFAAERPGLSGEQYRLAETWTAGAFFDSLIGQQDRNLTNMLLDEEQERLYLIDHGFAFANEGDFCGYTALVRDRRRSSDVLRPGELASLDRLVVSADLFGVTDVLERERAESLRIRARRMRATGRLLDEDEF